MTDRPQVVTPRQVAEAYQAMSQNPQGQVVLADLMRRFAHNRAPMFRAGHTRPEDCVYQEGQRSVLIHIGRMLDVNPSEIEEVGDEAL
ncbi:MAG: hypothetical protein GVY32_04170 [Gammaproteobacteria bacterium]|jgi:hypothetical protein|nr:hypothetical protein [Gammaproteobacteria bacterium]